MGAGDWLMAAGEARRLHEKTKRFVVILDRFNRPVNDPIWKGTPYITTSLNVGAHVIRNHGGCRPYIQAKLPDRWIWKPYSPYPAKMFLSEEERSWRRYGDGAIILNPHLKANASPNKRWIAERWLRLAAELGQHADLLQFPGDAPIPGVRIVETPSLRHAAGVMSGAKAVVTVEGALHHLAAALNTPAVVLFGGYISPANTGYAGQKSLFTGGKACGMRATCPHCQQAMGRIAVEDVLVALGTA